MAKTIDEALALFAAGKSPRECEKLTGIPATTINRKAKERGIIKGSVARLITDAVRVGAEFGAQSGAVQEVIQTEVSKQLEGLEFYATNARKVAKMGMVALSKDNTPSNSKVVMEMMKTGMQVEGIVPYYPNAVINNTNAQQNVIEPVRFTRAAD
jgi:hypothetical protein